MLPVKKTFLDSEGNPLPIISVKLVEQISAVECAVGVTFKVDRYRLKVFDGCKAVFHVCVATPVEDMTTPAEDITTPSTPADSTGKSACMSVCPTVHLSVHVSICFSVCLCKALTIFVETLSFLFVPLFHTSHPTHTYAHTPTPTLSVHIDDCLFPKLSASYLGCSMIDCSSQFSSYYQSTCIGVYHFLVFPRLQSLVYF